MSEMKTLNGYEIYDAVSRGYLTPVTSTGDVNDEGYCENYIATVEGITSLDNGVSFIMIPHADNAITVIGEEEAISLPTLNVNNLGAKLIRQRLSTNTAATISIGKKGFLASNHPVRLTYDGSFPSDGCWLIDIVRVDCNYIYGAVPIANGGTGADNAADALTNLGAAASSHTHSVSDISGAAPAYSYSTTDLDVGTSSLDTGKLYFVYE